MNNIFLFVYPEKAYFQSLAFHLKLDKDEERLKKFLMRYDEMIKARFRSKGFKVYWLAFSKIGQPNVPDRDRISEHITVHPEDQVISSGITILDIKEETRADTKFVRKQLPPDIGRLVVGGFHAGDCVAQLCAGFYEELEDRVSIELELTELHLIWSSRGFLTPILKTNSISQRLRRLLLKAIFGSPNSRLEDS